MPKPLILYTAQAPDGRACLILSPTKPTPEQAAEAMRLKRGALPKINTADAEDAEVLTVTTEGERDIPLIFFREG